MRVTLIDGPLASTDRNGGAQRLFIGHDDPMGGNAAIHARSLAMAIRLHAPDVIIDDFVIFGGGLSTRAATVTLALQAALETDADIVHCSFGLPRLDPQMARAVEALLLRGKLVVASAPAFGTPVYPAAFPGVISVQGDARCAPGDWTLLEGGASQMRFAAHAGKADDLVRGASLAAAHFTGLMANRLQAGTDPVEGMQLDARYFGRERRGAQQAGAAE